MKFKKNILFLSNHFVTLYSFRKELIKQLIAEGYEVFISTPSDSDNVFFEELGCKVIPTPIDRRGINPIHDLRTILTYRKIVKEVNPDIIFSYTIKPNIYGSLVSNCLHKRQVCNVTGTGETFLRKNLVSIIAIMLYRLSVKRCYKVFFQNAGDKDFFIKNNMIKDNYDLLPGSGVNLDEYQIKPFPNDDEINFIFIGRVMRLKGIDQYLDAARIIRTRYTNTRFLIAGWNEEREYEAKIKEYEDSGFVKYIGFQKSITKWIEKCQCIVLPSLGGEGIPNVLLESAACGRVCIASAINGCNEVVINGKTGFLFLPGNTDSLVEQMEQYLNLSYGERRDMGLAGRRKVAAEFDRRLVIKKYMDEIRQTDISGMEKIKR